MASISPLRPAEVSKEEWDVRCDLAALYRAFVRYGWTDLIYTHISARVPGRSDHYLINPFGLMFDEITASSLIIVDFDGKLIRGDWPMNPAGHAIHHTVLKARPDVNWVLHTHSRAGTAVACMKDGLLPLSQRAMLLHGRLARHAWDVQTSEQECDRLAADLGSQNAMLMENHGLLVCGVTAASSFVTLYNLEMACKIQVDVLASGRAVIMPDADVVERTAIMLDDPEQIQEDAAWDAVRRSLDRQDPGYMS